MPSTAFLDDFASSIPFARRPSVPSPWSSTAPVREDFFGVDRLEQHARSLAAEQPVTRHPPRVLSLRRRLRQNADALLAAYRSIAADASEGRPPAPAGEWLLDNYPLIEEQVREAQLYLSPGFYRQLPKLESGPFAGYPRVFGAAWAYVAHGDSHFDPGVLKHFIDAYQSVEVLTIGELWAFAITLRIVLIENLRRIANELMTTRRDVAEADRLSDRLLAATDIDTIGATASPLSDAFAAQLAKRLRDQDPTTTPAAGWLERRLQLQRTTVDELVGRAQQRQAAAAVTMRNIITSFRWISSTSWPDLVESVSRVDAVLGEATAFRAMDFATRNLYRNAIELLARGSGHSEVEVAVRAVRAAERARALVEGAGDRIEAERVGDPGYHLLSAGREAFEASLHFVPSFTERTARFNIRLGVDGYVAATMALTGGLLALTLGAIHLPGMGVEWLALYAFLAFIPLSETANAVVTRALAHSVRPTLLPGLELVDGPGPEARTLIVIPTLLTNAADVEEEIERLEVHYLSGAPGEFYFALLSDWADAPYERSADDDALLAVATDAMARLNARHPAGTAGARFRLLHRRRVFNASEGAWMGWERKRGKLHELNGLLRGADDTTFLSIDGAAPAGPEAVRYVITLDADTRLPRDAASSMVGKMQHPLNRPGFDAHAQRVVRGYAILQPRVTPALPVGVEATPYQRAFSGPSGLDPYAAAVSDMYQDLLGEGSYTGKGIYEVDAFEAAMQGRVPDNTMLSHDLFEGTFARAGLASDVEVIEDFPARYDVANHRHHRWTRGDWQLLPWIAGAWRGPRALPAEGRWKMMDNLRRSLVPPTAVLAITAAWLLPRPASGIAQLAILLGVVVPTFLPMLGGLVPRRSTITWRSHLHAIADDLVVASLQVMLNVTTLADRAWRAADAIVRTIVRMAITRRHLLEWTTAAQAGRRGTPDIAGFYRAMAGGTGFVVIAAGAALVAGADPQAVTPLLIAWLVGPVVAWWSSRPPSPPPARTLTDGEALELRMTARRTWRFFETFVTADEHHLPPDNYQSDPEPVVAPRTSPTNIGLYLLSTIAARDFGWIGTTAAIERIEATFTTLARLATFNGHFFNWYGTRDLRVLDPRYISSVDSGNLAGHLIALANACDDWRRGPVSRHVRAGIADTWRLARESFEDDAVIAPVLDGILQMLDEDAPIETLLPAMQDAADAACEASQAASSDAAFDLRTLRDAIVQHRADRTQDDDALERRLDALAHDARRMALAMDFRFLMDPLRKLLSIGYSLADNRLDESCYDLLASEARLASFIAIAKGDAPARHWFRLGRAVVPVGPRSTLLSWSGSMFEYLMPALVMRAPDGSLLAESNRMVVVKQQEYAAERGVPWGISESAFNARDVELTYQYSNFGVPGIGLKRGLADDLVIAPYATGLATMVDPHRAIANFRLLHAIGVRGRYGFHEAIDYTRSRVPKDETFVVVRNFMAHHQGMTIVALANVLDHGRMRERFHREPLIVATELLLQERVPRDVSAVPLPAEGERTGRDAIDATTATRRFVGRLAGPPVTHLLSNGTYAVMLSATGAGYSRWGDIAITRWREDPTVDLDGSYVYLQDRQSKRTWSISAQPMGRGASARQLLLDEHHAVFERRDGRLTTTLDVLAAGEDDGEVRRVTLNNRSRHRREIDLTSYLELVLTTVATDSAHPAFAKMFVETEWMPWLGALIATRRPRGPDEKPVWVAHFAVVEGDVVGTPEYESDRMRFLGRNRSTTWPQAMRPDTHLSGTTGTVLDPVFALRVRVDVHPGEIARVAWWTMASSTRDALIDMIDRHRHPSAFDRALTYAWTQAQVQLRHLGITADEAAEFQQLAAPLLYADARYRPASRVIVQGSGPQSGLWQHGISGDLPIVLLRIDDVADMAQVRQLLRGHEYWRAKRLAVDLVVVNERASSYVQDLQQAIEAAVRGSQSRPRLSDEPLRGGVFTLRADLMSAESRALLRSVARVSLVANRGPLASQLLPMPSTKPDGDTAPQRTSVTASRGAADVRHRLEFFNGVGGFHDDGREYVTVLEGQRTTPAPWIDVVSNPHFGFQASADGSGFTWADNSRENPLTPWSNDPVVDPCFEAIYVRDDTLGAIWTPTAEPIRDGGVYVARHGFGYVRFEHEAHGIALDLVQFVPLDDPIKISRLTIANRSTRTRHLTVTGYVEWALAPGRAASAHLQTEIDAVTGAMLARNPWTTAYPGRVAFFDMRGAQTAWTGDRTEFLGRLGSSAMPAALVSRKALSGATGAGLDPCSALQYTIEMPPSSSIEVVAFLGQCTSVDEVHVLLARYRRIDVDGVLGAVKAHWRTLLGTVQVRTPDRSLDTMLNGWLLYQVTACRTWARSAFYQASGAYGFRDQLQDGMALTFARPDWTRRHLLRAASRQFVEGDVQHWWLPLTGQGVRTRISDDRVWLAYAVATYVQVSGDGAVLGERVPFIEGPPLADGAHDHFDTPAVSDQTATLFEHCARGLDQCIALTGVHGIPLIGTGDWNDGMNRVGEQGRGESVWLGWLFIRTIALFAPLADRFDRERAARWREHAESVRSAIETHAWDGDWYRRATFDDGTWLGSKDCDECRIDSIAQSWAVLSEVADPERTRRAMASVEEHLVRPDTGLALLFTPPFDRTARDPGYIKGYPPGLRENGGQYTHAAMWLIVAFAKLGDADRALALFDLLNPIEHARTHTDARRYKVEPYVVAADVYSVVPHDGRGGWTWYTGSAAWMYRAGVESLLGIRREGRTLVVDPKLPSAWPGFEATVTLGDAITIVVVERARDTRSNASLDDAPIDATLPLRVPIAAGVHRVVLRIGQQREEGPPDAVATIEAGGLVTGR